MDKIIGCTLDSRKEYTEERLNEKEVFFLCILVLFLLLVPTVRSRSDIGCELLFEKDGSVFQGVGDDELEAHLVATEDPQPSGGISTGSGGLHGEPWQVTWGGLYPNREYTLSWSAYIPSEGMIDVGSWTFTASTEPISKIIEVAPTSIEREAQKGGKMVSSVSCVCAESSERDTLPHSVLCF